MPEIPIISEDTRKFVDVAIETLEDLTGVIEKAKMAGINVQAQENKRNEVLTKLRKFKQAFFPVT